MGTAMLTLFKPDPITRRGTYVQRPGVRLLKAVDRKANTATSVLTFPARDYAGDYVNPEGGDWSEYPDNPKVDWHHGIPIGCGSVRLCKATIASAPAAGVEGGEYILPVGTTKFFTGKSDLANIDLTEYDSDGTTPVGRYSPDDCLRAAEQASRLVQDDIAKGVSIEFDILKATPAGPSLLENRSAYDVHQWVGRGWAHTLQPVNPSAMTVDPQSEYPDFALAAIEKAISVGQSGRVGGSPIHPLIRKAFEPFLKFSPTRPKTVSIPVHPPKMEKAMPVQNNLPGTDDDTDEQIDTGEPDGDEGLAMKPTPKLILLAAQGAKDLCDQVRSMTKSDAEHPEGMKALEEWCQAIEDATAKLIEDGQEHFPDAGLDAPDGYADDANGDQDESKPLPSNDDGAYMTKAFKKGFPVRFKMSDLKPVAVSKSITTKEDPKELARLAREIRQLKRSLGR